MSGLVLGKSGQLASHLRELLPDAQFWGRPDHDLSQPDIVCEAIHELQPDYIVNAAAYTAVDKAESEPEAAWQINVSSVTATARTAAALDIPYVHVSTDYVFDGTAADAYPVDAPTCPINTYGETKLASELSISVHCSQYWVLRTSWVFSEHGNNFVKTMLRLASERDSLQIVADQVGVPTYAGDLARVIAALTGAFNDVSPGIYHAVGGPAVSWHDFAKQIFAEAAALDLIRAAPQLTPVGSEDFVTPARRPANSHLASSNDLLERTHSMDWQAGLRQALTAIMST